MTEVKSFIPDSEFRKRGMLIDENNALVRRYAKASGKSRKEAVLDIARNRADQNSLQQALKLQPA